MWRSPDHMLAVLAFLAAPPPVFVHLIEQRLAATRMHLVAWWADDLDGDHQLESIALACNEDGGTYMIERGEAWFELEAGIGGVNSCPDPTDAMPEWRVVDAGTITRVENGDRDTFFDSFAIRDGKLVLVTKSSQGTDEYDSTDYGHLTWVEERTPPHGTRVRKTGSLLLVTDQVRRPTKLIGASTIAATTDGDNDTTERLHIHADRALVIAPQCTPDEGCKTVIVRRGDSELTIPQIAELDVSAGGWKLHLRLERLAGGASYPPPR